MRGKPPPAPCVIRCVDIGWDRLDATIAGGAVGLRAPEEVRGRAWLQGGPVPHAAAGCGGASHRSPSAVSGAANAPSNRAMASLKYFMTLPPWPQSTVIT